MWSGADSASKECRRRYWNSNFVSLLLLFILSSFDAEHWVSWNCRPNKQTKQKNNNKVFSTFFPFFFFVCYVYCVCSSTSAVDFIFISYLDPSLSLCYALGTCTSSVYFCNNTRSNSRAPLLCSLIIPPYYSLFFLSVSLSSLLFCIIVSSAQESL